MPQKLVYWDVLAKMTIETLDKLPGPVEFRHREFKRGKHPGNLVRMRKRYVGIGWVEEGRADGSEPILVMERGSKDIPEGMEVWDG